MLRYVRVMLLRNLHFTPIETLVVYSGGYKRQHRSRCMRRGSQIEVRTKLILNLLCECKKGGSTIQNCVLLRDLILIMKWEFAREDLLGGILLTSIYYSHCVFEIIIILDKCKCLS